VPPAASQPEAEPSIGTLDIFLPSQSHTSAPVVDTLPNPSLYDQLTNCPYKIDSLSPFPRIKDGFLSGFREYLNSGSFKCLRVIFPIIPQYRIKDRNQLSTPYINAMDLSPDDVEAISKVDQRCLYRANEQGDCSEGQVRYFCSSWVSLSFNHFRPEASNHIWIYSWLWLLK
jgi:hypothetical protein